MDEITERVISLIKQTVDGAEFYDLEITSPLISSGIIDSFDIVTLIDKFELEFRVKLQFENIDLEDFDTPQNIAQIIYSRKNYGTN